MIYLTSDLHFCHNRKFLYEPRGFNNVDDMNEKIIENWNNLINDEDDVYVLGDLMLNDDNKGKELFSQLNGKIHVVLGNHDTDNRIEFYKTFNNIVEIAQAIRIKLNGYNFFLCHYPTITTNYTDDKKLKHRLICLYGHTHQKTNFFDGNPYIYHVGLDSHNNTPISIDDIIDDIIEFERKVK